MRHYSYAAAKSHAKDKGLEWSDAIEAQVDVEFHALGLTQFQVDRLVVLHIHYLLHAFTPSQYHFWARVRMAIFWLRGR